MAFEIMIDQFEGPLDLMLHLIKDNKLNLLDLDMDVLCNQYLEYISKMESLRLEIASEYLSELASLIEYKSKKLLPREKVEIAEQYEEDQRERLIARLLEYQRYKEVSSVLETNYLERSMKLTKPISEWKGESLDEEEVFLDGSPYDLMKAMQRVIRRMSIHVHQQASLKVEELSIDDRVLQVRKRLHNFSGKLSFEQLCEDCTNLHMVIVTFLAVLDLIKNRRIHYVLDEAQTIWIIKE
ncbi:MAG: segregation and condensation protein A [Erysipelotrichaceae bacterium]